MTFLTIGNSAKLYCLNWVENRVKECDGQLSILDLGCGNAQNFTRLLERYPKVKYVGIEPSAEACAAARRNLEGRDATIINDHAYNIFGRLVNEQFDVVISFSTFEHVYRRQSYINSARDCLKPDGYFLINYDSGHFTMTSSFKEGVKNIVGPWLALLGQERYYQKFVKEADFLAMVEAANMVVVEAKSFNTRLKGGHKIVPAQYHEDHMARWWNTRSG